ncbi:Uncharacterised protein [Mycobacteroides abscessus subsp. abscessus]|nr:Uncharacterised protein [Mycobacteroides abscessus subsp. abscessus]
MGASDEVPPHDDLLGKGLPAEEDDPCRILAEVGDPHLRQPGPRVADPGPRHRHVLDGDLAGVDEHTMFEVGVDGQVDARTRVESELGSEQRSMRRHG